MKIEKLSLIRLHNAEHFQFHADVLALLGETNFATAMAKFAAQLAAYRSAFAVEDEVMKQIEKSSITKQIAAADAARDEVYRNFMMTHKAAAHHLNAAVREAAAKLQPVFDAFSNLNSESLSKQSADTYNLIQELRTKYAEEVLTLGYLQWITEIEKLNKAVEDLMRSRFAEIAENRPSESMKTVRSHVDEAWRPLTVCIEAFAITETGDTAAALAAIIARLNVIIEHYNNAMAIRRGRAAAKKDDAAETQI